MHVICYGLSNLYLISELGIKLYLKLCINWERERERESMCFKWEEPKWVRESKLSKEKNSPPWYNPGGQLVPLPFLNSISSCLLLIYMYYYEPSLVPLLCPQKWVIGQCWKSIGDTSIMVGKGGANLEGANRVNCDICSYGYDRPLLTMKLAVKFCFTAVQCVIHSWISPYFLCVVVMINTYRTKKFIARITNFSKERKWPSLWKIASWRIFPVVLYSKDALIFSSHISTHYV